MKVKIGDTVKRKPTTFSKTEETGKMTMEGTVIYVHPEERFHVVEFGKGNHKVRESFWGVEREMP